MHISRTKPPLHYILTKLKIYTFLSCLHRLHEQFHLLQHTLSPLSSLCKTLQILSKQISKTLQKFHFIWASFKLFWPEVIPKQTPEILHLEVIAVIHAKCQNGMNQNFTSCNTLWPLVILPNLLLFRFILPLILWLHCSFLPIILFLKMVRIYITNNIRQLICLINQIKLFKRDNNISVTLNRYIN